VTGDRPIVAAGAPLGERGLARAKVVDQGTHRIGVGAGLGRVGIDIGAEDGHRTDYRRAAVRRSPRTDT
jgi:hypothetical protein